MTNLGPLTTTFTPQGSDCAPSFLGEVDDNAWIQYGVGGASSSACYPSSFRPYEAYYYSPGSCPLGYTAACTAQVALSNNIFQDQFTCCPESYTCISDRSSADPFPCKSNFDGTKTFEVSTFYFHTDLTGSTTKVVAGTTSYEVADYFLLAYGPLVFPQQSGHISTAASIETPSITTKSSTSTSFRSIATATSPTEPGGSARLSRGAIAGISVGSVLARILLIGAIVLLVSRRWKRCAKAQSPMPEVEPAHDSDLPQSAQYYDPPQRKFELSTEGRPPQFHELDA